MQEKVHLQSFSVQNSLFQCVIFVGQLQREERSMLIDKAEENLIAFPRWQLQKSLFVNPFKVAFVAYNLLAFPFCADKDVHLLGRPDIVDESNDATIAPRGNGKACFLIDFAPHAVLGALPFLELASHANPFVVVLIVLLLGAVQHEVLVAALKVTLGGLFHGLFVLCRPFDASTGSATTSSGPLLTKSKAAKLTALQKPFLLWN
jgi:hypothetical protein